MILKTESQGSQLQHHLEPKHSTKESAMIDFVVVAAQSDSLWVSPIFSFRHMADYAPLSREANFEYKCICILFTVSGGKILVDIIGFAAVVVASSLSPHPILQANATLRL